MGDTAVKVAKIAGYTSVGTVEFLVDKNRDFYFMEMNTRLQVEHGITEMISNVDIVREQINIAAGKSVSIAQRDFNISKYEK